MIVFIIHTIKSILPLVYKSKYILAPTVVTFRATSCCMNTGLFSKRSNDELFVLSDLRMLSRVLKIKKRSLFYYSVVTTNASVRLNTEYFRILSLLSIFSELMCRSIGH